MSKKLDYKKMTTKQLQKEALKINDTLCQRYDAELSVKNKKLVGKAFKYHNSYSYSGGDKWWLYALVTHLDGPTPVGVTFQTDCNGKVIVTPNEYIGSVLDGNNQWVPITLNELCGAWNEMVGVKGSLYNVSKLILEKGTN